MPDQVRSTIEPIVVLIPSAIFLIDPISLLLEFIVISVVWMIVPDFLSQQVNLFIIQRPAEELIDIDVVCDRGEWVGGRQFCGGARWIWWRRIVVVKTMPPAFKKRWILHSLESRHDRVQTYRIDIVDGMEHCDSWKNDWSVERASGKSGLGSHL
jgi:hypothetical protein